ncbi:MAG: NADH-quinone oxidoreductase subunit NuoE [Euryarchaeota archaeon]|nr:NADH-quinone oxidoreductase subunit NuoE [Euryarchaeota archaeon]
MRQVIGSGTPQDKAPWREAVARILSRHGNERGELIPILQNVQAELDYLHREALEEVARALRLSMHDVYGVATFYAQFRFSPPGRHKVRACLGTACHVRGGDDVMAALERRLGIRHGETTKDGEFSLERVACMGCCALAPVMVVGDEVSGRCTPSKVDEILARYGGGD